MSRIEINRLSARTLQVLTIGCLAISVHAAGLFIEMASRAWWFFLQESVPFKNLPRITQLYLQLALLKPELLKIWLWLLWMLLVITGISSRRNNLVQQHALLLFYTLLNLVGITIGCCCFYPFLFLDKMSAGESRRSEWLDIFQVITYVSAGCVVALLSWCILRKVLKWVYRKPRLGQ